MTHLEVYIDGEEPLTADTEDLEVYINGIDAVETVQLAQEVARA